MATPPRHDKTDGAPPREIHVEPKKTNWLAWLALAAGLLALLFFLINRSNDGVERATETTAVTETTPTEVANAMTAQAPAAEVPFTTGLGTYLAGSNATPRTFAFEKLNFDTGKSQVRPADRTEVESIVAALRENGNARVRIVGYADARGNSAANAALGKARADSVKAALVAGGITANRIETASGGESDPVETNATAGGQAENRRTELVVLSR